MEERGDLALPSDSLQVGLALRPVIAPLGTPVSARVVLANCGDAPLLINTRFSLGYPNTSDRDLYCEIFRENGERYLGYERYQVDYHARELSPTDFPLLPPGESRQTSFELLEWYRIDEPGIYLVRVIYTPESSPTVPDALAGEFASPMERLTIQS